MIFYVSDESDDEGTEQGKVNAKINLPDWALRANLEQAIAKQSKINPDTIFGHIKDCDLEGILK